MNSSLFTTTFSTILVLTLHHGIASSPLDQSIKGKPVFQTTGLVPEGVSLIPVVKKPHRTGTILVAVNLKQFCTKKIKEKGKLPNSRGIKKCTTKIKKKCKKKIKAKGKTPNTKSMKQCIRKITKA